MPPGQFETREVTYSVGGTEATKTVLVEGSFRYAAEAGADGEGAAPATATAGSASGEPPAIGALARTPSS